MDEATGTILKLIACQTVLNTLIERLLLDDRHLSIKGKVEYILLDN